MTTSENQNLAVLMTCHNRKEKTIDCLAALYNADRPCGLDINIYLVDDGSTDGTGHEVKNAFPNVNVIEGNGSLYWNGGMIKAWEYSEKIGGFDFFLWLNDDTIIDKSAIQEVIECYREANLIESKPSIIVGSCKSGQNEEEFSYGGRTLDEKPVIPNGDIQKCSLINGNLVLVPRPVYESVGMLSSEYSHGIGDNDYGLRAISKGFSCYVTKRFIADCPTNDVPVWCNPKKDLKARYRHFHSPTGLNFSEYVRFRKRFWKKTWMVYAIKAYLKMLMPETYGKLERFK